MILSQQTRAVRQSRRQERQGPTYCLTPTLSRLNATPGKTEDDKSVFGKDAIEELVKTTLICFESLELINHLDLVYEALLGSWNSLDLLLSSLPGTRKSQRSELPGIFPGCGDILQERYSILLTRLKTKRVCFLTSKMYWLGREQISIFIIKFF